MSEAPLMPEPVELTPRVVEWARTASGLSLPDAARRLHVGEDVIARWEADGLLTVRELKEAAHAYGLPVAALLLNNPPPPSPLPLDFRQAWGAPSRLSPAIHDAIRTTTELHDLAADLLEDMGDRMRLLPLPARWWDPPEPAAEAIRAWLAVPADERRALRTPGRALARWRTAIEAQGVFVTQATMSVDEVRGFSIASLPPFITLSRSDSVTARIYTMFHELVHVLDGTAAICLPQSALRRDVELRTRVATLEHRCNVLAAAILMPADEVAAGIRELKLKLDQPPADADLRRLAAPFSVSKFVVWYRLRDLDLVSNEVFHAKWAHWPKLVDYHSRSTGGGGETRIETALRELGPRFVSLVVSARNRDVLSTADALAYLRVRLEDFDELQHPARPVTG